MVWMWGVVKGLGLILWAMGSHGRLWSRRLRVLGSMFVCGTGHGRDIAPQPWLLTPPAERTSILVQRGVRPKGPHAGRRMLGLIDGEGSM